MQIVPVIDLKQGQVVRARKGDRANYRPIETPLSPTARPLDVVRGLLSLHPFAALYIADLDAITGDGGHLETVREIRSAFPALELWVDQGVATAGAFERLLLEGAFPIIGTESQADADLARSMRDEPRALLSLDFLRGAYAGPRELLEDCSLWPSRVIAMTLDRVGAADGPDTELLAELVARGQGRRIHAAGGVRDAADLSRLAKMNVAGALVASALHDGSIGAAEIAGLASGR